jgi:hypothetical protein
VGAADEVGIDSILDGCQPALLEPRDLGLGEIRVSEIGESRAAPQRKRLGQRRAREARVTVRERPNRSRSTVPGSGERRYPPEEVSSRDPSPKALRSRDTCTCKVFAALLGGRPE